MRSETGPDPESGYDAPRAQPSRRSLLRAVKEEDRSGEEGVSRQDDGGASLGRRERSLRGVITRPEGDARCFVPDDGGLSRCHANMFFVGVSKCGTTSFANWLEENPKVHFGFRRVKEAEAKSIVKFAEVRIRGGGLDFVLPEGRRTLRRMKRVWLKKPSVGVLAPPRGSTGTQLLQSQFNIPGAFSLSPNISHAIHR